MTDTPLISDRTIPAWQLGVDLGSFTLTASLRMRTRLGQISVPPSRVSASASAARRPGTAPKRQRTTGAEPSRKMTIEWADDKQKKRKRDASPIVVSGSDSYSSSDGEPEEAVKEMSRKSRKASKERFGKEPEVGAKSKRLKESRPAKKRSKGKSESAPKSTGRATSRARKEESDDTESEESETAPKSTGRATPRARKEESADPESDESDWSDSRKSSSSEDAPVPKYLEKCPVLGGSRWSQLACYEECRESKSCKFFDCDFSHQPSVVAAKRVEQENVRRQARKDMEKKKHKDKEKKDKEKKDKGKKKESKTKVEARSGSRKGAR